MTNWDLVSAVCVAVGSSYITLAAVAETEPYINEDGEEEYSIKGYILLASAAVVKWGIKKIVSFVKGTGEKGVLSAEDQVNISKTQMNFETEKETLESIGEFELAV